MTIISDSADFAWNESDLAELEAFANSQWVSGRQDPRTESSDVPDSEPDLSVLMRNGVPAVPFPVEIFGRATEWIEQSAACKSAPIDFVALALIVTAAGLIGAKRRVSPWDGWEEPSILWGALVGPPSVNKSPALDPLRDAVAVIEREANADWSEREAKFETEKRVAEARRETWEANVAEAIKDGKAVPDRPADAVSPPAPTMRRLWIVDATTEKVARILGQNTAGLIAFRDELAGWLGSFDRYGGSGSDRAFWLEAYGGRPYRYDRIGLNDDVISIPFCAVSLLGAVQPDRLKRMLLVGDDDGLAARPIYAWPDPVPPRRPTMNADGEAMVSALKRLQGLQFDQSDDGSVRPKTLPLAPAAADEFQAWWERIQWDAKQSATGTVAGAVGKLDGVALRLALVLEMLAWAWQAADTVEPQQVTLSSMRHSLRVIDEWVRSNLDRVFCEASQPQVNRDAMIVARWLQKAKPAIINSRELRRLPGFPGPKEAKNLDAALEMLLDAKWLSLASASGQGGRPRKDFIVNPKVYEAA